MNNFIKNNFTDKATKELKELMEIFNKNNPSDNSFKCSYCGNNYYLECDCNGYEDNRGR